jgi:mevalonate kinase
MADPHPPRHEPGEVDGFGNGKLILVGEHAVVHGHPALAFAVSLGTRVTLRARPGPREIAAPWHDELLERALDVALDDLPARVRIETTLPIGRGMGSSAALSVALVRAAAAARGLPEPAAPDLFTRALELERVFHANPSGLDVAVSVYGGVLRYRRTDPITLEPLAAPTWQVVVIDSGFAGSTKALVAGVTSRRPAIDPLLDRIGALVDEAQRALHDPAALGPLLNENQALLKQIGVSTPTLDEICALALSAGALGAKLSGAGGGGVVLALVDDPEPVEAAARAAGLQAWRCAPAAR